MNKPIALIIALTTAFASWAQTPPNAGWAISIPATNTMDVAALHCLPNGNVAVAGSFGGQLWPNSEEYFQALAVGNMFVLDYTPDRTLAHASIVYSDGPGQLNGMAIDNQGNRYLCGRFSNVAEIENMNIVSSGGNDIFIVKINPQGNAARIKKFGGTLNDEALSIAISPDGETIYLAGHYTSPSLSFGTTQLTSTVAYPKMFVARLDTGLNALSARTVQTATDDSRTVAIAVDDDGHVFTVTNFKGTMQLTAQSGSITSAGGTDVLISAWNSSLTTVNHEIQMAGANSVSATALAVSASGRVYVCGNYTGNYTLGNLTGASNGLQDVFAAQLDSTLVPQWAVKGGGTLSDEAGGLHIAADGKVFFSGTFQGLGQFGLAELDNVVGLDGFVLCLNPNGTLAYALQPGDQADEWAKAVCTNGTNGVFVAGMFNGPTTLANMSLSVMPQANDGFLMAYGVPAPPQSIYEHNFRFNAYPNPFSDLLHIDTEQRGIVQWQLFDIQNKMVVDGSANQTSININTSTLPNGVYSLRVIGETGIGHRLIVKN